MTNKLEAVRAAVAAAILTVAGVARAGGDSGTGSMGEMSISGSQFGMMVGGLAVLGVVIWGVAKFTSR
jgi:hypothetical protein